jgi:hypothetical protein
MPLFRKRKQEVSSEDELREIEASVKNIRSRMANHNMPLGDLFALMGEDERQILAHLPRPEESSADRFLPNQIAAKASTSEEPKPTLDARSNDLFFRTVG